MSSLEEAIAARATAAGVLLPPVAVSRLASHARLVLEESARLHLTTITTPAAFLERHLGEAFEGARHIGTDRSGTLLDLGSGNGYPGIPIAVARPSLRAVLAEASHKKAEFLRRALAAAGLAGGSVLEAQVQRATDLDALAPIEVLVTRAAGRWESIVPRLASALSPGGLVLIWAGATAAEIVRRASWRRLELVSCDLLPGRTASNLFVLTRI